MRRLFNRRRPASLAGQAIASLTCLVLGAVALSGCSGSGSGSAPARPAAVAKRPNIIFITIDTLRADRLGAYGSSTTRTPNLDTLIASSARFERAYAAFPKTNPALASMMTGRYPSAHGVRRNGAHLPEAELTLAEILKASGYGTHAFVSNHVMVARHGLAQGFDLYDDTFPDAIPTRQARERIAAHLVDAVLAWASAAPPRAPIFLWVHFIDPHGPYTPPGFMPQATSDGPSLPVSAANAPTNAIPAYQALPGVTLVGDYVSRYDAEVDYLDREAGRLIDGLRVSGLLDGAVVVLSADHGESLGDHGLYFQHGSSLYESQIRVPLAILAPGVEPRSIEDPVGAVDLMPTVLDRAGLPQPRGMQGTSLTPWLEGSAPPSARDRVLFVELGRKIAAIRGSLKLIWDGEKKTIDLHDVEADPEESRDIAAERPEEGRRLLESVLRFSRENTRDEEADDDVETMRVLKSLGYVE